MGNLNGKQQTRGSGRYKQQSSKLSLDTGQNKLLQPVMQDSAESSSFQASRSSRSGSSQQFFLIKPTQDYESFVRYVSHLNRLIGKNQPFLKAKFGVSSLSISTVLPNTLLLTDTLKKKLFDTKVAQTAILVQSTRLDSNEALSGTPNPDESTATGDFFEDDELVFIRKFGSVSDFMDKVRSLDTVLENIESFSSEATMINNFRMGITPDASPAQVQPEQSEAEEPEASASECGIVEEAVNHYDEAAVGNVDEQVLEVQWSAESRKGPAGSDLNTCCICLERQIEYVLTCFHAYCRTCIDDWRQRDPSCPLCRELEEGVGFDMINGPDQKMREQIKQDLMRELARIIAELLGEDAISDQTQSQSAAAQEAMLKNLSPSKNGVF